MSKSTPIVLNVNAWDTSSIRYMQPKVNDRGGKAINVISTQSNRSLHISTPLMMTWGISDYVDEKTGESDGKFSMSLVFPNGDYTTPATDDFLSKLKSFENQILDDAVRYSEAWFGEDLSREVVKHNFFPFLKYTKDKLTKKIDPTKSPSIRARVPNYNNKWGVEVYDTESNLLFPCDNDNMTPMDFVPKKSKVAAVLQCGGLWFGGKGWGVTWKVNQCVVKPQEVVSVFGKCHIQLSADDIKSIDNAPTTANDDDDEVDILPATTPTLATSTEVEDSEDEEPEPEPVVTLKKKIVKKATPAQEEEAPAPKKKVVKKKAVAT
uniref:Uncharacterized protein n=1 Tax=viral metagenome TaxID=1070528 RepID=A0A6C0J1H0_9ZZZZ